MKGDPLAILTTPQRELLWKLRQYCSTIPEALPKLLRCVRWGNLEQVTEVHRLLKTWRPITLEVALELLDYHFADEKVRALAVRRLEKLSNGEVQSFLLQLVQVSAAMYGEMTVEGAWRNFNSNNNNNDDDDKDYKDNWASEVSPTYTCLIEIVVYRYLFNTSYSYNSISWYA